MLSYKAKKNKVVYLLSSQHNTLSICGTHPKKKPEPILYYNSEKGGVDKADEMLRVYSTKAASRWWPLACFFNLLDIVGLNTYSICKEGKLISSKVEEISLISLGESLCDKESTRMKSLPHTFHATAASTSSAPVDHPPQHVASAKTTKQEPSAKIVHCLYVQLAQNQCVIHVLGQTQTFELESILF